jgi:hypothetical protein
VKTQEARGFEDVERFYILLKIGAREYETRTRGLRCINYEGAELIFIGA